MTENKTCPFMYSGFMEPCIEDQCMAWRTERRFNNRVELAPNGEPVIVKAHFPGYCKLIEGKS